MKRSLLTTVLVLSAGPACAATAAAGPGWFSIFVLLIVMGLLMVGAWAARKYGTEAGGKEALGLEELGQVPVNQKAGLALVRAGTQVMVLGLTAERISLLKEMPLSEFALEETVQAGELR